MNLKQHLSRITVAASAATLLVATSAQALPKTGDPVPAVTLTDAWERTLDLATLVGQPVLVVYEDKGSSGQNQVLKNELSQLAKGDKYKGRVALVATADLGGYDYWPVRGFVKDAIKTESHKIHTVIYCDWDGRFRNALGLTKGASNIVLYGKDGKVRFAYAGAMSEATRAQLIELLRVEVES